MSWNHRVLAHQCKDEVYLQIHEVYYDKNNNPDGYSEKGIVAGDDISSLRWTLNEMQKCLNSPILWAGEKFPSECKIKYTCKLCGRDTFDRPSAHKCKDGFRKRGLQWSISYNF